MWPEQRLRCPALYHPYRLSSLVYFATFAYGLPRRFRVHHRPYPLGRCESEHQNGLLFGFGFVRFRRYCCRLADVDTFLTFPGFPASTGMSTTPSPD